ncbi:hypothetical protein [Pseudoduganella violaceinigra]|uniref:hypothetical protein n=1 Tax=Pseudoduganella violaceinigra TaxID=246602 RepID=UPI00042209C0|nr:hypothetical protein [Pseudoduganella violaceinigra]
MGINKGQVFAENDVFIDYSFEKVMYRWDHVAKKVYVRFYGEDERLEPVPHDNRLYNEAILSGDQIDRENYEKGRMNDGQS